MQGKASRGGRRSKGAVAPKRHEYSILLPPFENRTNNEWISYKEISLKHGSEKNDQYPSPNKEYMTFKRPHATAYSIHSLQHILRHITKRIWIKIYPQNTAPRKIKAPVLIPSERFNDPIEANPEGRECERGETEHWWAPVVNGLLKGNRRREQGGKGNEPAAAFERKNSPKKTRKTCRSSSQESF